MIPILMAVSVGGAFVLGFTLADRLRKGDAEWMAEQTADLIRDNAELRAEIFGHIFRPVTPEESDAVMAEWLSRYDPRVGDDL